MRGSIPTGLVGVALAAMLIVAACTHHVTGPDVEGIETPDVAIDAGLQVLGLEEFQRSIETETWVCGSSTVALDFRDHAFRVTQAAWQFARDRGAVAPTGVVDFQNLDVHTECKSVGGWACQSRAELTVSFADGDQEPTVRWSKSKQDIDLLLCSDTADLAQRVIDTVLKDALGQFFAGAP